MLVFIIPNKEGTVRFIMDYCRINLKSVKKTCMLSRIGDTMQQLEGLQYATALYINMGNYTIRLSSASKDMMTIVTEFLKFRYNPLLMDMRGSGDIFQTKVDELLGYIEGVKTYIDDILILSNEKISNHV